MIRVWLGSPYAPAAIVLLGVASLIYENWPSVEQPRQQASDQRPEPERRPPPSELLDALGTPRVGDTVSGWTIDDLSGVDEGGIAIGVHRNDEELTVTVMPRGAWSHSPPVSTGTHDFFYGGSRGGSIDAREVAALLETFARRMDPEAESRLPPPSDAAVQ